MNGQNHALSHSRNQIIFWAVTLALIFLFVWIFKGILLPFVLGMIIAYLLDPAVKAMRRRNIPRWAAALLILGAFGLVMIVLILLLLPVAYKEVMQLVETMPHYIDRATQMVHDSSNWLQKRFRGSDFTNIQDALQNNISTAMQAGGGLVLTLATGGWALINIIYTAVLTPIIAFLMMNDWPRMKRWLDDMVPRGSHETVGELWHEIDAKLSGFIRGQLTVCFLLGMSYAIALTIAGLNFGFLIGLMIGVMTIIPLVGSTTGLLIALTVGWFQTNELSYLAIIGGIFFMGQFVEGNILTPRVMGKSVGMHSLWVLFALMAGGALFGIVGMLMAVPVTAVVGVLMGYTIRRYKQSAFYNPPVPDAVLPEPPASGSL
jgi:predicted PurR-regulated permease PerM